MYNDHPMQPTPDQVQQWIFLTNSGVEQIRTAYAAGADAQLEACVDAIYKHERQPLCGGTAEWLRAVMRPKPPTLADLAAKDLAVLRRDAERCGLGFSSTRIEAALERLAELEGAEDLRRQAVVPGRVGE